MTWAGDGDQRKVTAEAILSAKGREGFQRLKVLSLREGAGQPTMHRQFAMQPKVKTLLTYTASFQFDS